MKRTGILLLAVLVAAMLITGCGRKTTTKSQSRSSASSVSKNEQNKSAGGTETAAKPKAGETAKPDSKTANKPDDLPKAPPDFKATAKSVIEQLATTYKSIDTLKLDGTIIATITAEGKSRNSEAQLRMDFARPNKIVLKTIEQGNDRIIVSDGKTMFMYVHNSKAPAEFSKIYRKETAPKSLKEFNKGAEEGINTPGLLSGMDVTKFIKLAKLKSSEKINGVDTYVVTYPVQSKGKGVTATETIWIGKNDFLIRQIKTDVKISPSAIGPLPEGMKKPTSPMIISQKTVVKSIKANQAIPEKTFKFTPPPGSRDAASIKMPEPQKLPPPPDLTNKKAPDFSLQSLDGKQVSLSNYRGKPVLLVFWGMGSPQSKQALPEIQKVYKELESSGVVVLGINMDVNNEATAKFVKEHNISFPIVAGSDKTFKTATEYGLRNLPTIFVIGEDGNVKGKIIGQKSAEAIKSEAAKLGVR